MDKEILNKIKEEYNDWIKDKYKIKTLINKINRLEKHPAVIEYLQSVEMLDEVDHEKILNTADEEKIFSIFKDNKQSIENTNKIYLYFGTFRRPAYKENEFRSILSKIATNPDGYRVERDDPKAHFRVYYDIESSEELRIDGIEKCNEFEKNNKVIITESFIWFGDLYNEIQKEFITTAVKQDEEQAVQKVLRRNNQ